MVAKRPNRPPLKGAQDAMRIMNRQAARSASVDDPRKAGREDLVPLKDAIADPRQAGLVKETSSEARASIAAATLLGGADVMAVGDLNWQIEGTGDFNNDTNVDILWRNTFQWLECRLVHQRD